MKKLKFPFVLIVFLFLMFVLNSCAPGNEKFGTDPAGFWMGLWHGFISLFTFIISLFSDNVTIYEINNSGNWYNFGFILGVSFFFGGSSTSGCRKMRC